jgi:hypothetical protein
MHIIIYHALEASSKQGGTLLCPYMEVPGHITKPLHRYRHLLIVTQTVDM